ncbi:hypothetical protein DM48_360 [Burkholderia gladioli]|uniref:Uncharacterized protein n=1 Tax=Burkholderia gladioli TaxID=28095 RepID=A0AAW3EYG6_BURGA|nr:hypothetical protein [Burkholderia gladioli]KGC12675.1 hypothetical protein DM48_360 [Burkholderia gladioli]
MDTQDFGGEPIAPVVAGLAAKTWAIVQFFAYMIPDEDRSKVDFNATAKAIKVVEAAAVGKPGNESSHDQLSAILEVLSAYYDWRVNV